MFIYINGAWCKVLKHTRLIYFKNYLRTKSKNTSALLQKKSVTFCKNKYSTQRCTQSTSPKPVFKL